MCGSDAIITNVFDAGVFCVLRRSTNVQVFGRLLQIDVIIRERLKFTECILIDFAAILTNAAEQTLSRGAEGAIDPAGVSFEGFPFLR